MIRVFDRTETNFNHNMNVITPISCFAIEESNGMFELECEVPQSVSIDKGDIIKAPTPRGEQLFRVYRPVRTLKGKKIYAKHIFYDLAKNFIINYAPSSTCDDALKGILSNTEVTHCFVGSSNVTGTKTAAFTRINPVSAILGTKGIVETWGGYLYRDNFNIKILSSGQDNGYDIRMGKNLTGIEDDSDDSDVVTRLYPTVILGDSNTVHALPEKYVDSPLINNYGNPIIKEQPIDLTDEQKALPIAEIYNIMRNYCSELYSKYNVDKPVVNYKINFVELSKTEQYKNFAILEKLDLYDVVSCYIPMLGINVKANVIKYKYDCIKNRYDSIELGKFSTVTAYQASNIVKQISERFQAAETAIDHATNTITGNKGGYVVIRRYPNGKPYEILIMDTEDINTAKDVLRINKDGIGFSRNGYNGPYGTAMTIDGHLVADFVDTGTLTAILIKSLNYMEDAQGNITAGAKFDLKNGILKTLNGIFSGSIYGSIIQGSTFISDTADGVVTISNGKIKIVHKNGTMSTLGGEDMFLQFLIVQQTASFMNAVVFNELPTLFRGGTSEAFITNANKKDYTFPPDTSYLASYALESWVQTYFAEKNHDHAGVYQPAGNYLVSSDLSGINSTLGDHESRIYTLEHLIK